MPMRVEKMKEKELKLLRYLHANARESLTNISKETGIPISTLFETQKQLENNYVHKHTALIDFQKIGYALKTGFIIKAKDKEKMKKKLMEEKSVNTLTVTANGPDYYTENIFKDLKELEEFKEMLTAEDAKYTALYVVESIKQEEFCP